MTAIVIGLVPALFWGILPIWIRKYTGGDFRNQLLGTTIGIVIVAGLLTLILHLAFTWKTAMLFFLSGFCWSFGQAGQYYGYEHLGVSLTMPLSTALQIVGNSLIGGLVFGEWHGSHAIWLSLLMLVIIIVGVALTNGKLKGVVGRPKDYLILVATTAGYWGYSALPHYAHVASNLTGFLPQALGMLIAGLLISSTQPKVFVQIATARNITAGLIFSVAAATYLVSLSLNGTVNAFVLSQLNVVVATLFGGLVLHEFVKGQVWLTLFGLIILIGGATGLVMI